MGIVFVGFGGGQRLGNSGDAQEGSQEGGGAADVKTGASADDEADKTIRLRLMEGSLVSGKLTVDRITVTTDFGTLEIPVVNILSFRPGLDSHPQQRKKIGRLILQLGSKVVKERDNAQKELMSMGPPIRAELEEHKADDDAERRTRIQKILADFDEMADEEDPEYTSQPELIPEDTVKTNKFTVVGKISPQSFTLHTKFGDLNVALTDIREVERETEEPTEIRKTVTVSGTNLVQFSFKDSKLRVERGDKVSITADGKIVMSPWGNNQFSTPDGGANFQWYVPNKIPGGALVAKIGSNGPVFKVGSKHSFSATKAGTLYFAVAMNAQFANQGYAFPGDYNVKVRVNSE